MNNIMTTEVWYANDASNDKYVTCMSSMIEQMRVQGFAVACKWLEVTGNMEHRKRFTLRRRYWLFTVRLRYAEYVGCEAYVHEIRQLIGDLMKTLDDDCSLKMYQVLEIACNLSLYRISDGKVLPMFKTHHATLLGIVDDFMAMQRDSVPPKSLVEDYSRLFDLVEDIEKISGNKLYQAVSTTHDESPVKRGTADIVPCNFDQTEARRLNKTLSYVSEWLTRGEGDTNKSHLKVFLETVEVAKRQVDQRLTINTDILFYGGVSGDELIRDKIKQSREYLIEALSYEGIELERGSFWQLYIELIIQKSINKIGRDSFKKLNSATALRQTASWPLHEKMHSLIPSLAGDPEYLKQLLSKKLIKPESLLYGIFSTLSMQDIPTTYCEYDVLDTDAVSPRLVLNRSSGGALAAFYGELVELVYAIGHCRKGEGFCLRFPHQNDETTSSLDMACVCTDNQVLMVGMSKDFTINHHHYVSSEGILGQLFSMAGFEFSTSESLAVHGPNDGSRPACRQQCVEFEACDINTCTGFVNNFVEATISFKKRGKMYRPENNSLPETSYVAEMINIAHGV